MKRIPVSNQHSAYLDRTARRLSELFGTKVTPKQALSLLLDLALEDEEMYDLDGTSPIDPYKKEFKQIEKEARTASFDVVALLDKLKAT